MTNGDHENSQESQPGSSQAENMDVTVPPQVPESETSESNESATGQLASMLDTDFDPSQHEEEHVELEADKKNAKIVVNTIAIPAAQKIIFVVSAFV